MREETLDISLDLTRRSEQVETQNVQNTQERPDICLSDTFFLNITYYFLKHRAIVNGLLGDETCCLQPMLENRYRRGPNGRIAKVT